MSTIRQTIEIDRAPEAVWAEVRSFGDAQRLFPGVVLRTTGTGAERTVTFADGSEVREQLVACDDGLRRLVYAAVDNPAVAHHSSALEVLDAGAGSASVVWTTDILPDTLTGLVASRMRAGAAALRRALTDHGAIAGPEGPLMTPGDSARPRTRS